MCGIGALLSIANIRIQVFHTCIPMIILLLTLFLLVPIVSAEDGIFTTDQKYIDNIRDLPYFEGIPDKTMQNENYINAYIDIVGFHAMVREDGIDYVQQFPDMLALVRKNATGNPPGAVDDITSKLTFDQNGTFLVAILDVKMKWKKEYCEGGCWYESYTESASFQDSEVSPLVYPTMKNRFVTITEYNNTIAPKTTISINTSGISKVSYRYGNEELTHYLKRGHVDRTAKGVYFLNLTKCDCWTNNTKNLQHLGDLAVIPNTSRPDYSQLRVDISNPYTSMVVDDFLIERISYTEGNMFSDYSFMIFGIVITFLIIAIIVIANQVKKLRNILDAKQN
ncbi:MAG: hypothetical protein Q8M95_07655 [Candidatus Methanoperedens sp.]|nr:hypothetical protein [Candidatus Methanoperedens sp.]